MYSKLYHMVEASVVLNKLVSHTYIYIHIYAQVCVYIYTCIYSYKMTAVAIAIHLIKL